MTKVLHKSIIADTQMGLIITTLCGRNSQKTKDGYMNITKDDTEVTCKHCIKAMGTYWGQEKIKLSKSGEVIK